MRRGVGKYCSLECRNVGYKGRALSLETRTKMGDSRRGIKNPAYGIPKSNETRAKISAALTGRKQSFETKQRRIESLRKCWERDLHPMKRPEIVRKVSNTNRGKKRSPDTLMKLSVTHIGLFTGSKNPMWRGGTSFLPYCPEFNSSLKRKVKDDFGHRCFLSGLEENSRSLDVHHIDYDKQHYHNLIPLSRGWHVKTNFNRWYWFSLLKDYWAYKYLDNHGMDTFDGPDRTTWLWQIYNRKGGGIY